MARVRVTVSDVARRFLLDAAARFRHSHRRRQDVARRPLARWARALAAVRADLGRRPRPDHNDDAARWRRYFNEWRACAKYVARRKLLVARDGSQSPVEVTTSPIRTGFGEEFGRVLVLRDARDLAAFEERMRDLAYRDGLTGLANRRSLEERLATMRLLVDAGVDLSASGGPDGLTALQMATKLKRRDMVALLKKARLAEKAAPFLAPAAAPAAAAAAAAPAADPLEGFLASFSSGAPSDPLDTFLTSLDGSGATSPARSDHASASRSVGCTCTPSRVAGSFAVARATCLATSPRPTSRARS